ncbi:MAG: hypothetical protein PHH85_12610 [Candidatus Methanoperedens sp.]|nr:hypothetical protein [Candidatus Methanoperedens sp.]
MSSLTFSNEEGYFDGVDQQRIVIDKVFCSVWDENYCTQNHTFDQDLANAQHFHMKRGAVKKGRFEEMFHFQVKPYMTYDLRFRGPRGMRGHVNIIEYLQDRYNLKPASNLIIHDSNFMPLDCTLTLKDYINALNEAAEFFRKEYIKLVKEFWGEDLEHVKVSVYVLELAFEVYPCSTSDVAARLENDGISFRKYNNQSGTIYFDDAVGDIDYELPNGLTTKVTEAPGFDSVYVNNIHGGYNDYKMQLKYYQKSFGLVRIEFTIFKNEISTLFSLKPHLIDEDCFAVKSWIHKQLRERDKQSSCIGRFDVSLEAIVREASRWTGLSEDIIYLLKDLEVFQSSKKTHHLRLRLMKRGFIVPIVDDLGNKKRKLYKVSPQLKAMLSSFKPRGTESFLPSFISRAEK